MATVSIKFSQNVVDQQRVLAQSGSPYGTVNGVIGRFDASALGADLDADLLNWSLDGSTLNVAYTNNVNETYIGVVRDNPFAASGHATATSYELRQAGVAKLNVVGRLNFDYALGAGNNASLETSAEGHMLTDIRLASEYAASNPNYDPVFGNVSVAMSGHLALAANGVMEGSVNTITIQADKLLQYATMNGSFFIDANQPGGVGGALTSYVEGYHDGSTLSISGIGASVASTGALADLYTNPAIYGGDDVIDVDLPGHLYQQTTIQAGAGNDRITLKGGGGLLGVNAGDGNDTIVLVDGAHSIDGGAGIDTVQVAAARSAYAILAANGGFTMTDKDGVVTQLVNVERIAFTDTAYALDIAGHGGQAYRIYQAAFARTPDAAGLGFWISMVDQGVSMTSIAQGFVNSQEYRDAYGLVSSNRELVYKYYANILHRAPEDAGLNFWTNVLDTKAAGVADVLAAISESTENQQGVAMLIGNGFAYTPYAHG